MSRCASASRLSRSPAKSSLSPAAAWPSAPETASASPRLAVERAEGRDGDEHLRRGREVAAGDAAARRVLAQGLGHALGEPLDERGGRRARHRERDDEPGGPGAHRGDVRQVRHHGLVAELLR
jgi:hypothetical protein